MGSPRKVRVAQSIRQGIGELIRREVRDPRVAAAGLLSVNHVEVNRDLSVAYVYVAFYGGDDEAVEPAVKALERVAGALRGPLARHLGLKRAPELRFLHDTSAEMGMRLSEIVRDDSRRGDGEDFVIDATLEVVAERIAGAKRVLLSCHRGPDGDSVGSMVALASLLRDRGVVATLYNPDLVPRSLKWLPHTRTFVQKLKKDARYNLCVVVDTGDPKLLGKDFPAREVTGDVIVLDHHKSGVPFGDLYLCDPGAASVGVLVSRIAAHLGWSISDDAAQGLYISIVSDTGSFRYSNTNAEVLRLAAELVERGVDPWSISERMGERGSLARYRLLAAALGSLELAVDGLVAFMTITDEMVKAAKATWEDSEGMVNYARSIKGVDCGVLITPAKHGGIRVSMRSKGRRIDAGAVCKTMGGGGHVGAAGCTLEGEITAARTRVEAALVEAIGPTDAVASS